MENSVIDRIVWGNFKRGSKQALEIIYEEHFNSLYYYGLKFTSDCDLIKDTIHELFIDLIDMRLRLSDVDNIGFYLLRAFRNKLTKSIISQQKHQKGEDIICAFSIVEPVEEKLIREELEVQVKNKVLNAIKKLSVKQQEIIYLRFYNDMSYQKIAELFDVNVQTVRNLMHRAIKSLKDDLKDEQIGSSLMLLILNCQMFDKHLKLMV